MKRIKRIGEFLALVERSYTPFQSYAPNYTHQCSM
jgi:hypothetical protein